MSLVVDVCVIGLGVVGLPLAALFAQAGLRVHGSDINLQHVQSLQTSSGHHDEPGLDEILKTQVATARLTFSQVPVAATAFILATPTYHDQKDPYGALSLAIMALKDVIKKGDLIVVESTCAPGTTRRLVVDVLAKWGWAVGTDIFVAHCPERVLPGAALRELVENERLLSGATDACLHRVRALYQYIVGGHLRLAKSLEIAEAAKLVENAYREMNIAFVNQLSGWANAQNLNVYDLIHAANSHPRVELLNPGPGVGGRCLPLASELMLSLDTQSHLSLLEQTRKTHTQLPGILAKQVMDYFEQKNLPTPKRIALLGVAYKGNVGDARNAPAFDLIQWWQEHTTLEIGAYDPLVQKCDWVNLQSLEQTLEHADAIVICARHETFADLDALTCASLMRQRVIFDFCNITQPESWIQADFDHLTR